MPMLTALIYWAVVIVWLCVLATAIVLSRRNRGALGTTRLLLVVVAIDTIRNVIENSYFGAYFGGKYGLFPEGVTVVLGDPYLLILPKIANIIAGGIVLGVLLLRWLPHAIEERARAEGRAEYFRERATRDGMTGLWNRHEFVTLAEAETRRAARYRSPVSLLMFDIDNFKSVNDRFGHDVGDRPGLRGRAPRRGYRRAARWRGVRHSPPRDGSDRRAGLRRAPAGSRRGIADLPRRSGASHDDQHRRQREDRG